jgi:hypothetical protein
MTHLDEHERMIAGHDLDERPGMDHPEAVIVWLAIAAGAWLGIGIIAWAAIIVASELWRAITG